MGYHGLSVSTEEELLDIAGSCRIHDGGECGVSANGANFLMSR
jgi:hypothetical protein